MRQTDSKWSVRQTQTDRKEQSGRQSNSSMRQTVVSQSVSQSDIQTDRDRQSDKGTVRKIKQQFSETDSH